MPFDGSGVYTRPNGIDQWRQDQSAAIKIRADLHDSHDNDIASALSLVLLRNGLSQVTADIPFNGKKLTHVGDPASPQDVVTLNHLTLYTPSVVGQNIHAQTPKPAPADLDEFVLADSVAGWLAKRITFGTLKALFTTPTPAGLVPAGVVVSFAGKVAPTGWLLIYGQAVLRATYPDLDAAIYCGDASNPTALHGYRTVAADGLVRSTTGAYLVLPDGRGYVDAGKDDMGGVSANRLTTPVDGDVLGAKGGVEAIVLAEANLPPHAHAVGTLATAAGAGHSHFVAADAITTNGALSATNNLARQGVVTADQQYNYSAQGTSNPVTMAKSSVEAAHTHPISGSTANGLGTSAPQGNVQPTIVYNKIIKT